MKKNFKNLVLISGIAAVIMLSASCTKTNDNSISASGLMAFNLVPDVKGIGITLSGNNLSGTPLMYTNYTGGYLSAYPGTRSVTAYDYFISRPITSSSAVLDPGKYYSLFVVGANNQYQNLVVKDNFDSLSASSGQAYIRYLNAIPDSSSSEITINAGGTDIVKEQSGFTSVSGFVPVNAGRVTININNGGNIQAGRIINVDASKIYTVLLTGIPGDKDSTKAVQIKYIENGTATGGAADKRAVTSGAAVSW